MKNHYAKSGSVVSAFFASLCCIGPIIFALIGLGGAGFLAVFEEYRLYLIILTLLFLGSAFYFTYRKREVVCTDGTCKIESSNFQSKFWLWLVTVFVFFILIFPSLPFDVLYKNTELASAKELVNSELTVEGMHCDACNVSVEIALKKLDGVERVKSDYTIGTVTVEYDSTKSSVDDFSEAINKLGYKFKNSNLKR